MRPQNDILTLDDLFMKVSNSSNSLQRLDDLSCNKSCKFNAPENPINQRKKKAKKKCCGRYNKKKKSACGRCPKSFNEVI